MYNGMNMLKVTAVGQANICTVYQVTNWTRQAMDV